MDVALPDGTIVSGVPDGTSKTELATRLQRAGHPVPPEWLPAAKPETTLAQRAAGTGEAALATITAPIAYLGGLASGGNEFVKRLLAETLGADNPGQYDPGKAFDETSQALQYTPRTESGKDQTGAVMDAMQGLAPLAGMTGEAAALSQAMKAGRAGAPAAVLARAGAEGVARDVAGPAAAAGVSTAIDAAGAARQAVTTLPRRALAALSRDEAKTPTPGTMGSAGAAATDLATQRAATAESVGLTGDAALTKGQATRDPAQLKFEVETAKNPEMGGDLRARRVAQNEALLNQIERDIDSTGAVAPDVRAVGNSVDAALVKQYTADKAVVNDAYRAARSSPEANAVVDQTEPVTFGQGDRAITSTPLEWLNSQPAGTPKAALLDAVRQDAVRLGIADMEGGKLVPKTQEIRQFPSWMTDQTATTKQPVGSTINQMERWREEINGRVGIDPSEIRQATILKGLIDGQTEPVAGPLYRQARGLRTRLAQNYEDRSSIAKLLAKKPGTQDRAVALEDVFDHTILKGSLDDVTNVQRVLLRSGPEGKQAWSELQGQTLKHIRDTATRSVAADGAGNRVISPAALDRSIRSLDHDGKLERIFGKQGAQRLRDINDIAQVAKTVPPEAAINFSNTAATLLTGFADLGASAMTGVPAPLATATRLGLKHIQNKKLRARIADALAGVQRPSSTTPATP